MKKIIYLAVLLMICASAFAQDNPVSYSTTAGTTNDTVTVGLIGDKILTVKNNSITDSDTLFVYTPQLRNTAFNTTPFALTGQEKNIYKFYGNKFIIKANVSLLNVEYWTGDYEDNFTVSKAIHYVDTVSYKDTLDASTISVTYEFGSQYSNVKLIGMSDTAIAGGDTLRAYNIGYRGDTTDIYFLDSASNRVLYIVSPGDCKYKEYRLDILCPENVMFVFNDSPIYTTKWYLIPKAYKK